MNYLLVAVALILSGCYKEEIHITTVEPVFFEHLELFEKIYNLQYKGSIILTDYVPYDSSHVVAVCENYKKNDSWNVVYVQKSFWEKSDYYTRQELLFHELGHCALNRRDDDTLITIGDVPNVPKSIMYPWIFGDTLFYRENLEYYLQELGQL